MSPRPDRLSNPLLTFFAIVFGTTWLLQLPSILVQHACLAGPSERYAPLVVLGYFVPVITALALSGRPLGGTGVRALLHRFGAYRVPVGWYLLALAHPALILTVGWSLARLVIGPRIGSAFYPPVAPAQLAAMVVIPFTEQIPWRGFVYPPLEKRVGSLRASLIVGTAWALFHLEKQAFLGSGLVWGVALWTLLLMTAGTVVFTWFYRRTGSMFLVVIANAGVYLDNSTRALPANAAPLAVQALGYCAVAFALILFDSSVWRLGMPSASSRGPKALARCLGISRLDRGAD